MREDERRIAVNGIDHWIRVAGAGEAPPIVVIHGGPGGNNYVFERTIGPRLERFATVVYYEQRGCGRSAWPDDPIAYSIPLLVADLEEIRRALDIDRIVPLGYSFGAELAAEYALAHPARVSGLILQALSVNDAETFARIQIEGFARVASGEIRDRVERIRSGPGGASEKTDRIWKAVDPATVDRFLFEDPACAELNRALWRQSGLVNTGEMARALRAHADERPPLRDRLRSIRQPTLVIVGLHDRTIGVEAGREIATIIPHARLELFDRSAHFPDVEEPVRYADVVRQFLSA